jgi:hypothetical protein
MKLEHPLVVYLPDTRGVEISPFGLGNLKIGPSVFTYSKSAGHPYSGGTCPGASIECEAICYAKRIKGIVLDQYRKNDHRETVPPIPAECQLLRIHVSGDFDSTNYIENWYQRLVERPDVQAWAYTRSWRCADLLPMLEKLRTLPNVQLFASMDSSILEDPPLGWRRAWIDGDARAGELVDTQAHSDFNGVRNAATYDGTMSYLCPEETRHVPNCESCGYCIDGRRNDVTFLKH